LRTYIVRPTVAEQARQALRNLTTVLDSEGASLANIVHWSIAVVDGQALGEGFAAFQQAWNLAGPRPAITVHVVGGLGPGVPRRDRRHRRRVALPQTSGATG